MQNESVREVFGEMCQRVGVKLEEFNFNRPEWFMDYSWTVAEQDDFRKWLIDYLLKHKEARKALLTFQTKNKKLIAKAADWFILDYGWTNVKHT